MTVTAPTTRPYDEIDVSSRAFWSATAAERERNFAILRTHRPLSWHPPAEAVMLDDPDDPGFWAVVRHADIVRVSRKNDVFVSGQGVIFENAPQEILEASQSFLAMDPPRHDKIRKLVSAAFTPRQVKQIEEQIRANAKAIVTELATAGSGVDFVKHCASQLPIRTLSDMMGIPAQDRVAVMENAEALVSSGDPAFVNGRPPMEVMFEASAKLHQIASAMAAQRRNDPRDDLMTNLVQAEVDGDQLTDADIAAFFVQRHHPPNHQSRTQGADRLPGATRVAAGRLRWPYQQRGRRIRPLVIAGDDIPADGGGGYRARRAANCGRRQGGHVLPIGQLGLRGIHRPGLV